MIDLADQTKRAHSFLPGEVLWGLFAHRRLLGAVLLRAIEDIQNGEKDLEGTACGCPADVPCSGNKCPNPIPYKIISAEQWVFEMSEKEWGFGWVCRRLGRDPVQTSMAILGPRAPDFVKTLCSLSQNGGGVILGVGH